MIVIPAIDLKDGKCVRLRQGRPEAVDTYSEDPVDMARRWAEAGAVMLHLVDLNGAFIGEPVHTRLIAAIAAAVDIPVQVGGGLRTRRDVTRLRDAGVRRMIFGTRAVEDPDLIGALAEEFGEAIAVGIDARQGRVQVRGWMETTLVSAVELGRKVQTLGVRTIIYTDTARDGMLQGVNVGAMDLFCREVGADVIASGGVTTVQDVRMLAELKHPNLKAVIVGKALYEGRVDIPSLNAVCAAPGAAPAQSES